MGMQLAKGMGDVITLRFESALRAPAEQVWAWITSASGIRAEMRPLLFMTVPRGIRSLEDVPIVPGIRLFRSYVFLFGFLPIDYSDMTLLELRHGQGFVEQSPMGSMQLWRHERNIVACPTDATTVLLIDQLTFQPRAMKHLVGWFIQRVFIHRHNVLRKHLGGAQGAS